MLRSRDAGVYPERLNIPNKARIGAIVVLFFIGVSGMKPDSETGMSCKKHLHAARGTVATKLMTENELTDHEVAGMMGWSPDEVSRIRHVYVDQRKVVVALGAKIRRAV